MSKKKKKREKKSKTIQRILTLVMGLGFLGSMLGILLAGVFGQNNYAESENTADPQVAQEQLQMQIEGYEKVLQREPKNSAALKGLAQIHMQTGNMQKTISILQKIVEYYPEDQEAGAILQVIEQQQAAQAGQATPQSPATNAPKTVAPAPKAPEN